MADFDFLNDLAPHKSGWKVRVKILRLWSSNSFLGKTMEMVVCDERGTRIHVTIAPTDVPQFEDHIAEGDWKIFHWFSVRRDTAFGLKTTPSSLKIEFLSHTIVRPTDPVSDDLFLMSARFYDIIDRAYHPEDLIDVIGVIHRLGELREFQTRNNNGVITNLRFELINPEKDIILPCVARQSLARDIYDQIKRTETEHIVCVLRFWIISEGKGVDANSVVLSCSTLSDFMLNPVDPEAERVLSMYLAN